jgi:hypothetical protein
MSRTREKKMKTRALSRREFLELSAYPLMAGMLTPLASHHQWRALAPSQTISPARELKVRLASDLNQMDPALVFDPSTHYVVNAINSRLDPGRLQLIPRFLYRCTMSVSTAFCAAPDPVASSRAQVRNPLPRYLDMPQEILAPRRAPAKYRATKPSLFALNAH